MRRHLLLAFAFVLLCFGLIVQEFYEPEVTTNTGAVLRKIQQKTQLLVTDWASRFTGENYHLPPRRAQAAPLGDAAPGAYLTGEAATAAHVTQGDARANTADTALAQRVTEAMRQDANAAADETVRLQQIRFRGADGLGPRELQALVQPYIGKELKFEELIDITVMVENHYRKHNFVARVILPPQDLDGGVLELEVIESVLSQVEVEQGLDDMPHTQDHLMALIAAQQPKGERLNTAAVDRGVALANEVPGVSATAALQAGKGAGETDLILKLYAGNARKAEIMADNYGSWATGTERVTASLTLLNPGDIADLLALNAVKTAGSEYLRAAYSWAIGSEGWRMGVNVSSMSYEVIKGAVGVVGAKGRALVQGLEWTYPLSLTPEHKSTLALNADQKEFLNISAQGQEMSNYRASTQTAEIRGLLRDLEPGGLLATYSVQYTQGDINLAGSLSQASDQNGARTEGPFSKVRFNGTVLQPLTTGTSLYGSVTLQHSAKNLDSSEKMSLGGIAGVRAYPSGEAMGSDGALVNLELRHNLNDATTLSAFYDWGRIHQMHDPDFPGGPTMNAYDLKGYGLSLSHTTPSGVQIRATWARRHGNNPNPTQTGMDQDGTYDRNRYWLQVVVPF